MSRTVKKIRLNDIGYTFPSDPTLDPTVILPQVIKIDALASFESVGITSFGRGFSVPPTLVVLDGKTGDVVSDVALKVTLRGSSTADDSKNMSSFSQLALGASVTAHTGSSALPYQNKILNARRMLGKESKRLKGLEPRLPS